MLKQEAAEDIIKRRYARQFGLPASQIRFLGELNEAQLKEVRGYYSSTLENCENYIYAVKSGGTLVWGRKLRNQLMETTT